ncbi:RGCVC family protein [Blastococcus sp. SYSU DS0510]
MTSSMLHAPTTTSVERRAPEQAPAPGAACGACPHPRADHDAIAARFCSATVDGAIARGCACRT